jgi:hypothetical protein
MAEELGHALHAVEKARVNHAESVDLIECDSNSRMELLDLLPGQIVEKSVHTARFVDPGTSRRLLNRSSASHLISD